MENFVSGDGSKGNQSLETSEKNKKKFKLKKKEKNKSSTGAGGNPTVVGGAGGGGNDDSKYYKIEIRKLPTSDYNEQNFRENLKNVIEALQLSGDDIAVLHFMEGKISRKRGPICGAGFVSFKDETSLLTFLRDCPTKVKFLEGESFDAQPVIIPAPYQKKFKSRERPDRIANTIDTDPDFLAFCESLNVLIEPLPSAELQLDSKEKALKAGTGAASKLDLAKFNPLLLFLKEKSDLKFAERKERMKGNKNKLDKKKGKKEREREKEKEKEPPKILLKKRELGDAAAASGGLTILSKNLPKAASSSSAKVGSLPTSAPTTTVPSSVTSSSSAPLVSKASQGSMDAIQTARSDKLKEKYEKRIEKRQQEKDQQKGKGKGKSGGKESMPLPEEIPDMSADVGSLGVPRDLLENETKERGESEGRDDRKDKRAGRGERGKEKGGRGKLERKEDKRVAMPVPVERVANEEHEPSGGAGGAAGGGGGRGGGGRVRAERGGRSGGARGGRGRKDSESKLEDDSSSSGSHLSQMETGKGSDPSLGLAMDGSYSGRGRGGASGGGRTTRGGRSSGGRGRGGRATAGGASGGIVTGAGAGVGVTGDARYSSVHGTPSVSANAMMYQTDEGAGYDEYAATTGSGYYDPYYDPSGYSSVDYQYAAASASGGYGYDENPYDPSGSASGGYDPSAYYQQQHSGHGSTDDYGTMEGVGAYHSSSASRGGGSRRGGRYSSGPSYQY